MRRIALATSQKYSRLTDDDRLLIRPLKDLGYVAEPAVWTDPDYPWHDCAAVVIRSCWDYHLKPAEFSSWLNTLEQSAALVLNSVNTIRANIDKIYLRDLEARGVNIVPTIWLNEGRRDGSLKQEMAEAGWTKAVVKPRISATAHNTRLVTVEGAESAQPLIDALSAGPGVMVQKFMESITSDGEWSLIFFAGEFSHAVLKKAKVGDFRVQNDFGGTFVAADPPSLVLQTARKIVASLDATLYTRVDGVVENGRFFLMELELIEPALFLGLHPDAAKRFAKAINMKF
jgi:glutathione synthase/RimK-type ligase-like ATP-grasp enzyme